MLTVPTWVFLLLAQTLILLAAAAGFLAWLARRRRSPGEPRQSVDTAPATPAPVDGEDMPPVRRYLQSELARTRAQRENNDRNLPDQVLDCRLHYLQAELEALDYSDSPDPFWAHLCDRIESLSAPAGDTEETADLATTQRRLQHLLTELEQADEPSQVTVRQLAVIERRLAALQQNGREDEAPAPRGNGDDQPAAAQEAAPASDDGGRA
ncbi:hypothetical protein QWY84_15300 [Aquisalimonas lutea]|uniref:hypothetical protein n=1 Tax=Aquisalimonas lutea TaxID=1327750 RepID=UPI0025B4CE40|nr:hypothetical protein [Aquisalimonas lutea]MDN3518985.1 hypothetical protein [Aquisalimonas lutea]